jgi:hypothetical protein
VESGEHWRVVDGAESQGQARGGSIYGGARPTRIERHAYANSKHGSNALRAILRHWRQHALPSASGYSRLSTVYHRTNLRKPSFNSGGACCTDHACSSTGSFGLSTQPSSVIVTGAKSSEEGLEQAFNSLDAQREACAAFILSQKHEGWTVLQPSDVLYARDRYCMAETTGSVRG